MSCGCENTIVNSQQQQTTKIDKPKVFATTNCDISEELLLNYQKLLLCCKYNNSLNKINLTTKECNSYLGYLQSALNYPDNYCYYYTKIDEFRTRVLPLILNNVPYCTEQL